ncbi:MAG: hypothetical protein ACRDUX_26800 [Mycobacterium sp.]
MGVILFSQSEVHAGGKISIDDNKWISLGVGVRSSYTATQDAAPSSNDWSSDFNLDNARIYINGQIHEYIKFEVNTECAFCGNSSLQDFIILDAIAKFEFAPYINVWGGRLLVPAERQELNGPFYSTTYEAYKTPFFPADFSTHYGVGGAGVYERDNGFNLWGAAGPEGAFQYVAGVFTGLQSGNDTGPNQADNPLFGARVAYNFLNVEKNPGYYTSGSYFGSAGDILTLGLAMQYQEDGAGSFEHPGNFFGLVTDLLFEKPVEDVGVFTINGEYKYFDSSYSRQAFTDGDPNAFLMFSGNSFSLTGLYLIPKEIGIGKFQPYVRYSGTYPQDSADRDEFELGTNYVIDGFNARLSLFYQYGDLATLGLNYAPTASGGNVSSVGIAVQLQI